MSLAELDIPTRLPVANLSASAVKTYLACPLRWKHRYVDRDYEAPSGQMVLGSSVGAAEGHAYQQQIDDGERPATDVVVDLFADEWEDRIGREEIDWRQSKPGELKDAGVQAVTAYDLLVVPGVDPVSVEREFLLSFDGVEWGFTGFYDLEEADGAVSDLKVKARKLSVVDAATDIQPTAYLLARRAEGNPAPVFRYHTMIRTKQPYAEVVPTVRTDGQLDAFTDRLMMVAAEINWRLEMDVWQGAVPGSWICSANFCGYHATCRFGGAR